MEFTGLGAGCLALIGDTVREFVHPQRPWQGCRVKSLYGFSPLSVATLFLAALVLPILLFPFGAVLLANVVFSYGNRFYKRTRKSYIFDIFILISFVSNIFFLHIIIFFGIDRAYQYLISLSLLGGLFLNEIPSDSSGTMVIFNVATLVFCFNSLILLSLKNYSVDRANFINYYSSLRFHPRLNAGFAALNMWIAFFIVFTLSYFIEFPIFGQEFSRMHWSPADILLPLFTLTTCFVAYIRFLLNEIIYPKL